MGRVPIPSPKERHLAEQHKRVIQLIESLEDKCLKNPPKREKKKWWKIIF